MLLTYCTNCTNCDIQSKLCIQKIYANYGTDQKYGGYFIDGKTKIRSGIKLALKMLQMRKGTNK